MNNRPTWILGFSIIFAVAFGQEAPVRSVSSHKGFESMGSAGRAKGKSEEDEIRLVDIDKRKMIPVDRDKDGDPILLPNRFYLRFEPLVKKMVLDFSGPKARFKNPPRYLLPLSDFPGEWIGGKRGTFYTFRGSPNTGWNRFLEVVDKSKLTGIYLMWEFTDPPEEKEYHHSVNNKDF